MIEHLSLRCRNPEKSRDLYLKALAPLGYRLKMTFGDSFGFKEGGHTSFWVTPGKVATPSHVAFNAKTRAAVDAFYAAAMGAGAKDNGPPGVRKGYGYAAFVLDPDGHNIEAVTFVQPKRRAAAKGAGAQVTPRASPAKRAPGPKRGRSA